MIYFKIYNIDQNIMSDHYIKKILQRIIENTNTTTNPGIIIASPSESPPYKFHWIRDSALVMRTFIDIYKKTKNPEYFQYLINYIENESKIQKLNTTVGLGEPKYNINCSTYEGEWGRPQNDGPALRGIIMFQLIDVFRNYHTIIHQLIVPIILNDLNYIIENYRNTSFDLWEELNGWHFYTRMVQTKFIKDALKYKKILQLDKDISEKAFIVYQDLLNDLKDHVCDKHIISSFNKEGDIIKYHDAANLLAYSHINYDEDILKTVPLELITTTCDELIQSFRKKYNNDELNLIGRYHNDKYYNGHIWIICSLSLAQIYVELYQSRNIKRSNLPMHKSKSNPNNNYIEIANQILEWVLTLDTNLILSEQYNPITMENLSADKLTWNYSELYLLYNLLN